MSNSEFFRYVREGTGDGRFASSALRGARYHIYDSSGHDGIFGGSDVNYYYQGLLWAERGISFGGLGAAISAHNFGQAAAQSWGVFGVMQNSNIYQIPRAAAWARFGYDYANKN